MEELIEILMRRDGMTRNAAENLIEQCQEELYYAEEYDEAADIIRDYLGLEPDYLDILL